jgi:hypothetical protein
MKRERAPMSQRVKAIWSSIFGFFCAVVSAVKVRLASVAASCAAGGIVGVAVTCLSFVFVNSC